MMITRLAAGVLVATLIAGAARASRTLTTGGAAAAIVIGTAAMSAGWKWGLLLVAFFVSSVGMSRVRRTVKAALAREYVEKHGARDATQVFANGAVFAAGAVWIAIAPGPLLSAATLGALATATADTWATEIGMLSPRAPRSIVTFERIAAGMSGGVSAAGTAAAFTGAGMIACAAWLLGESGAAVTAGAAGGMFGMLADSVLGATVQSLRRCDACGTTTEQTAHVCGGRTTPVRGWPWLSNDGVNAGATALGAVAAAASYAAFAG